MNTYDLRNRGVEEELPKLLRGKTVVDCDVTHPADMPHMKLVHLTMSDGSVLSVKAHPQWFTVTADIAPTQYAGAMEVAPDNEVPRG